MPTMIPILSVIAPTIPWPFLWTDFVRGQGTSARSSENFEWHGACWLSGMKKRDMLAGARRTKRRKWIARVKTRTLDVPPGTFTSKDPAAIALAVRDAAERRSAHPYSSAMSYLSFYVNRGGRNLPEKQRRVIERAKKALRALFQR